MVIYAGTSKTMNLLIILIDALRKTSILTAVLGAHDLSDGKEGSIRFQVETYHVHPAYNSDTYDHDIMLLKVNCTLTGC